MTRQETVSSSSSGILSSDWIPREHVLFRIDWDKYRGSACVVTTSRVITVTPNTNEAEGYITRFDIDCPEALHCGACSLVLRQDPHTGDLLCHNMECGDYSKRRNERSSPSIKYGVRADLSDEAGAIIGVKMSQAKLETRLGLPGKFIKLSDMTRTGYKWSMMLRPLTVTLVSPGRDTAWWWT